MKRKRVVMMMVMGVAFAGAAFSQTGTDVVSLYSRILANDVAGARGLLEEGVRADSWFILGGEYTTILHVAARSNRPEMVRMLIAHGADAAATDAWGETPLMVAARFADVPVVELLLDAGCDPCCVSRLTGQTASEIARSCGNEKVAQLLEGVVASASQM